MNKQTIISSVIVLAVVLVLVFITIKGKNGDTLVNGDSQNQNMQNETKSEGVLIAVVSEGSGSASIAGDIVSVNYTGYLTDGTMFDSNVDPRFKHTQPFIFKLGEGEVIKGWDEGVNGMKIGEKRRIEIAPEFAYGEQGVNGIIPPNATLVFDVELLEIYKQ